MRLAGDGEVAQEEEEDIPVAVAVRLAPLPRHAQSCVYVNPISNQLHLGPDRTFCFDYVYSCSVSQEEVYETSVLPLLTALLDGYNVTVLAYGASGSGKTFTLAGPDLTPALNEEQFGIIPRVSRSLFHVVGSSTDVKAKIAVSFIQVYNEEVRDLLSEDVEPVVLEVDSTGGLSLTGLTTMQCSSISEVLSCLDTGMALQKSQPPTGGPGHIPAHAIFSIYLEQLSYANGSVVVRQSTFQFVDLVGSDQLSSPQGGINLGLLALGNVISGLGDPRRNVTFIPYQDSLLTRLLASALGGNSVTLLICTITSLLHDYEESLSSLLFASRAANIRTNPTPNIMKRELVNTSSALPYTDLIEEVPSVITSPVQPMINRQLPSHIRSRQNSLVSLAASSDVNPYLCAFSPPAEMQDLPMWHASAHNFPATAEQLPRFMVPTGGHQPQFHPLEAALVNPPFPVGLDMIHSPYGGALRGEPPLPALRPAIIYNQVSPGYNQTMEHTTPTSVSPLSLRSPVSVNMYLPAATVFPLPLHNRPSSSVEGSVSLMSEAPVLGNQGHLLLQGRAPSPHNLTEPRPALQHSHTSEEEVFKLQFAATQYKTLVTKAENLLQNISQQEKLTPPERNEIQTWLNRKEESDQAIIRKSGEATAKLELILEESEDETETQDSGLTPREERQPLSSAASSIEDKDSDDFDSQESIQSIEAEDSLSSSLEAAEELEERLAALQQQFMLDTLALAAVMESQLIEQQLANQELVKQQLVEQQLMKQHITEITEQQLMSQQLAEKPMVKQQLMDQPLGSASTAVDSSAQRGPTVRKLNIGREQGGGVAEAVEDLRSLAVRADEYQYQVKVPLVGQTDSTRQHLVQLNLYNSDPQIYAEDHLGLEYLQQCMSGSIQGSIQMGKQFQLKQLNLSQEYLKVLEPSGLQNTESLHPAKIECPEQPLQQDVNSEETSFIQSAPPDGSSSVIELSPLTRINDTGYLVSDLSAEVEELRNMRDDLIRERQALDDRLQEDSFLPPQLERRMLELDESIEAIDSAIEYKNDILLMRNVDYEKYEGEDILMQKLVVLRIGETRSLLHKYFVKVLDLRLEGRKMEIQLEEVENQYASLGKNARDLAYALQRTKLDCERRLVAQQRDYQVKINLLMQQLAEDGNGDGRAETARRIRALEKEVHYYKKLCKELKMRMEDGDESHVTDRREDPRSPDRGQSSSARHHRSPDRRHHKSPDNRGLVSPDRGYKHHTLASPDRGHRDPGFALKEQDFGERKGLPRSRGHEMPFRGGQRQQQEEEERIEMIRQTEEEEEIASDTESAVSQIQPSQIAQFQRRLARLHRRLESTPKPTVTREHRKIIIENPTSTHNSLESKKNSKSKKRR